MSIESHADWKGLREAARVARLALDRLEANVAAGITTRELDRIAADVFAAYGARSAPQLVYGFPGTVLISVNDEIVHGIPGDRQLERGDLVKLDVTVEKDGYIADAARSVLVDEGSPTARRLVECATAAFHAALSVARAGTLVNEISRAVESEVRGARFVVIRGLSGHGVGRTIHEAPDVPNEYDPRQRDVLTEGLAITIEPMISVSSRRPVKSVDGWTMRTHDGSLAAHHEHTLVITKSEPIVLTA